MPAILDAVRRVLPASITIVPLPTACMPPATATSPEWRCRLAFSRWFRSDSGAAGVMFTSTRESGFRDAVFVIKLRSRRDGGCRAPSILTSSHVFKPVLRAKRPAILRRTLGSKMQKMVFGSEASW